MLNWFRNFMAGRYGSDQLGWAALILYLVLSLFLPGGYLHLITLLPLVYFWYRFLSRDIYSRRAENQKFLNVALPLWSKLKAWNTRMKDREHKYFTCPNCKQKLRVPRGKGKIQISCPNCGNVIEKKT